MAKEKKIRDFPWDTVLFPVKLAAFFVLLFLGFLESSFYFVKRIVLGETKAEYDQRKRDENKLR